MGRLVVFEGIDGSGKSTQFAKLCQRLSDEGREYKRLQFPRYSEASSALIRMYLSGEFGKKPDSVNAYTASTFYAVDRAASYLSDWRQYYGDGGLVLTDRYTTSNAIHQASKLCGKERKDFFRWLYEFEFERMGLPEPDRVIYMDVTPDEAMTNMRERERRTGTTGDIHETDEAYLRACAECGREAADFYKWDVVRCFSDGKMRTVEDIHEEVYALLR